MIFHSRKKKPPDELNKIIVDDITISRVHVTKYLGLHIDELLSWNQHVNQLCKSLTKFFGIFKKLRDSITKRIARQLYFSFIFSRINYGIQVYGSCTAKLMSRIQILSNKLLKYLLKLDRRTPTNDLHKDLKILKVEDLYSVNILAFVKKCLFKECPELFKDYFVYQNHNHDTRDPKLRVPINKIGIGASSLKIKGASLWNNLKTEIKNKAALKSFKKIVTLHFVSRY